MTPPRVTVIVPLRNAGAGATVLLDALAAQDLPATEREVIVVDDASTDDTATVVAQHGTARLLRAPRWGGAYDARNLALERATGEVIAFTDGDCRPEPSWLRHGLAALDDLEADLLAGHVEVPLSARPGIVELLDFARYLDQERAVREAGFGATANLFVRRSVLDVVGPFRAGAISDGDRDLCVRATAAGFRLAYAAEAVVVHEPRRRAWDLARRGVRDGFARAQVRAVDPAARASLPAIWTRPGAWFPSALVGRSDVYGVERLIAARRAPGFVRRRALGFAEWSCVQLPMVGGSLLGGLRERARARRR